MERRYLQWWSPNLGRGMELLVFGHAGTRVLMFPTRCGRFFDCENFGMLEGIRERIEHGWLQLWCVDSVDQESFYADWKEPRERIRRHQAYEDYLLGEVFPRMADGSPMPAMTAGCSMGAYHAVNLALRHPTLFVKAVGLSGRYDLTRPSEGFRDLMDGHFEDSVYFHMPNQYVANAAEPRHLAALRQVDLVLACGDSDPFLDSNHRLDSLMHLKGLRSTLHVWSGRSHGRRHWSRMLSLYL